MAAPVLMPKVGISVESCIITQWLKKSGDQIKVGDILFSYETDKSSLECESTESGELLEVFFDDGDEVPVLTAVCAIGKAGEDISALRPSGAAPQEAPTETIKTEVVMEAPAQTIVVPAHMAVSLTPVTMSTAISLEGIKISPRARKMAEKQNIDYTKASPTGPYGRIIERDVRTMLENGIGLMTGAAYETGFGMNSGTAIGGRVSVGDKAVGSQASGFSVDVSPVEYEDVSFTPIRKAISRGMTASKRDIPQLTHNFSFDATAVLAYRSQIKATMEQLGLPNITLNDFVLFAVSRLILKYPALNAHMIDGNTIRYFSDVHLGIAVDTPKGLMVPVIKYADRKSLAEISADVKELAAAAQQGTISPDKLTEATFTISNLGTVGVESFSPIINPPETGILGVCKITDRIKVVDGEIVAYPAMGISLTYDHRAIDGAPASRFAHELCKMLENFTALLAI